MSAAEIWLIVAGMIEVVATVAAVVIALVAMDKKTQTQVQPQPLRIIEEIHHQFASRKDFAGHVRTNTDRHSQLFNRIDATERGLRSEMDRRFEELQLERGRSLASLNEGISSIREDISAIKTELRIRTE
jgi:hypothetical protein